MFIVYISDKYIILKKRYIDEINIKIGNYVKMYNIGFYLFVYFKIDDKLFLNIFNLFKFSVKHKIEIRLEKYEEFYIYDNLIISNNYLLLDFKKYLHNFNIIYDNNNFFSYNKYNEIIKYFDKYNSLLDVYKKLLNINNEYHNSIDNEKIKFNKIEENVNVLTNELKKFKYVLFNCKEKIENLDSEIIEKKKDILRVKKYYRLSIFFFIIIFIITILMIYLKYYELKNIFSSN